MITRRHVPLALGFLMVAAASVADAQGIASSYEQLRLLVRPGDTVSIVDVNGQEATGKILDLASSSLALQVKGARVEVLERDVRTIRQRRGDSLGNGALWGLGTGASIGFLAGSQFGSAGFGAIVAMFYGGIGAGVGVGIDAMITGRQVIYARPGVSSARVRVSPLLTRDRHGAQLSVRF
jgi:hypothetical protein